MTNSEISQKITDIGNILEILDENSFKVTAYQRAGRYIDMISDDLEDIYHKKGIRGLKEIRGIGESIAEKIEELINTGKIKYYNQLLRKVSPAIIKFSQIPGVGPKTAKKLYDTFHVKDIRVLKKVLKSKAKIDLILPKTRENILFGIKILESQSGRMLISFAEPIAREIVDFLQNQPEVGKADAVGSLRRMKETIGDVDVIASLKTKNNENLINKFIHATFVKEIVNKGETKATIIHQKNVQVDLEILPSNQYGSLLQHFTGSKDHNITLRTWAEKHGFSISEHGIKRLRRQFPISNFQFSNKSQIQNSKSQIIKCEIEEKVYKTLGMQTPPPEIRENQGEIEAALRSAQGKPNGLPKLIKLQDIRGDLQMHTIYSDGYATIREMAQACRELGYQYMAITDHTSTLGITQGMKSSDIDKIRTEISKLNKKNLGIKILFGVEANIKPDGQIDIPDNELEKFDLVLAAIHSSFRQDTLTTTKRLIRAIANPYVNIIAHPTGRIIGTRPGVAADWQKVFEAAHKNNVAMEVDAFADRLDLNDTLIHQAIKAGVKICINTDSHNPKQLIQMRYGVSQARRAWAEKKDVLNSFSLDKFLELIK